MADRRRNNANPNQDNGWGSWGTWALAGAAAAVGAAAVGTAVYYARRNPQNAQSSEERNTSASQEDQSNYLSSLLARMNTASCSGANSPVRRDVRGPDEKRQITNLNGLLEYIYANYVSLKDIEFEEYYRVFDDVFHQLHRKMKQVDPYYERYSSTVQLVGSHYDRLRISKPDEFDVIVIIGIPLNLREHQNEPKESDIVFEPRETGFVELRLGKQFSKLMYGHDWNINKTAYAWADGEGFLLRSNFMNWFKGVVDKALNLFEGPVPVIYSNGVPYTLRKTESGPARTLIIENKSRGFKVDVDLVPALKFPEERWPITNTYREIRSDWRNPENIWVVVPKPNKKGQNPQEVSRSWRMGMQVQERKLIYNSGNLRKVVRLLKKLRDAQKMDKIASYYLKTLVLLEALEREDEPGFWNQNVAKLFTIMVKKFHYALVLGKIPYFWTVKKKSNLIENINPLVLREYASRLEKFIEVLEDTTRFKEVAEYLLTSEELREFKS